jgi:protein SCO1/2
MSASSATQSHVAPRNAGVIRLVLLGSPLLIATVLFIIWRMQIAHLQHRNIDSFGQVPPFTLTNQDGRPFGSAQLSGKIWIADFVFTTCPGPCPMISSRMGELQKPLAGTGIHLVSFSVDPEKDTPEVLRGYAEKLKADPQQWDFLTGPKSTIYQLSTDGFHLAAVDNGDHNPIHSTRMILVDRRAQIRGYYDALAPDAVTKIVADAKHLLREQPE